MGINNVKLCDSDLKPFYSEELSQETASFAFSSFKKNCTAMAYQIGIRSLIEKKKNIESTIRELEVKEDRDVVSIEKWNTHLLLSKNRIKEFDERFSKYRVNW